MQLGYVAQLDPKPKGITKMELAVGSKVLGFVPSALNTGPLYSLDSWGGVKLVQPSLYMLASRVRAAASTVSGFKNSTRSCADLPLRNTHSQSSWR